MCPASKGLLGVDAQHTYLSQLTGQPQQSFLVATTLRAEVRYSTVGIDKVPWYIPVPQGKVCLSVPETLLFSLSSLIPRSSIRLRIW